MDQLPGEEMEFFFTANNIADANRKKAIIFVSTELIRYLCLPATTSAQSYKKALVHNHLQPAPNIFAKRIK